MIGDRFTAAAERAAHRYSVFLMGLEGLYARHAATDQPGSALTRQRLAAQAYGLAETFLSQEISEIDRAVTQERDFAFHATVLAQTPPSDAIREHTQAIAADLEHNLRTQLERDIGAVAKALRSIELRAILIQTSRNIPRLVALDMVRQSGDAGVQFHYTDRAQRKWSSTKLVRTLYRHAFVLTWNETALLAMADWGFLGAVIQHPDASHGESGTVISLAEDLQGVSWEQVREDVFHPNSNAWVEPYSDPN